MPKAWKMTSKRKEELARYREESMVADRQRMMAGMLVDGVKQIEAAFRKPEHVPAAPAMATATAWGQRVVGVRR
jgi:hypothetical protein